MRTAAASFLSDWLDFDSFHDTISKLRISHHRDHFHLSFLLIGGEAGYQHSGKRHFHFFSIMDSL